MPRDGVLSCAQDRLQQLISAPSAGWSTPAIAINAEIITRRWRGALSVRHIAGALSQGREAVREALRILECHGITQYTRQYGWRVCGRNVKRGPIAEISVAVDLARRHALGEWLYRALDGTLADRPVPSVALLACQYQVSTDTVLNALAGTRFLLPWLGVAHMPFDLPMHQQCTQPAERFVQLNPRHGNGPEVRNR